MYIIRLCLVSVFSLMIADSVAQNSEIKEALLIIDIQEFYFPGGDVALNNPEKAAANAALLLKHFREKNRPVVFIRHNYEPGGMIHNMVEPLEGELVISKDKINAFIGTGLDDHLKQLGINSLVICGMQTHMCAEAATRAAADLDYKCTLIRDACATRDLQFEDKTISAEDVHLSTLITLRSYAKVISTKEYLETLKR
ncbi:MAG TPA: cysteine hydrolase family protein [Bacteroidales bacterium]|nr:cysteine hydrolase family protein [Bacteroidales bacterium]